MVDCKGEMNIKQVPRYRKGNESLFCVDDCIATYAKHYGINYEMMYLDALKNRFVSDCIGKGSIGNCILFDNNYNENLRRFAGISREPLYIDSEDVLNRVCNQLDNENPVGISIDGYWCPWDWRYKVVEGGKHEFFLVGLDKNKMEFECVDPYYKQQCVILSMEDLRKGIDCFDLFKCVQKSIDLDEIDILKMKLNELIDENYLNSMKEFVKEFKTHFNIKDEIPDSSILEDMDNIYSDKIVLNNALNTIVYNRLRFAILMEYLQSTRTNMAEGFRIYKNEMLSLADKWDTVKLMFIKLIYTGKFDKLGKEMFRKLDSVVSDEEEVINNLIAFLNTKDISFYDKETLNCNMTSDINKITCINIKPYFNSEGIGNLSNCKADFNCQGEFFIEKSLPCGEYVEKHGLKFYIEKKLQGVPDNISCISQKIQVNSDFYNKIMILGCSEWGDYKDYIRVYYEDGSSDKFAINVSDWVPDLDCGCPENTLLVASKNIKSYCCFDSDNDYEQCYVYYFENNLNQSKRIKEILLPECANIHVFSMSLAK